MFSAGNIKNKTNETLQTKSKERQNSPKPPCLFESSEPEACPYFTLVLHKMEHLSRLHFCCVRIFTHSYKVSVTRGGGVGSLNVGLNQAIVFPFASFLLLLLENSPKDVLWAERPLQHSFWSNPHLQLGWGVLTHSYIYNDERTCVVNSSSSVLPSCVGLGYLSKD